MVTCDYSLKHPNTMEWHGFGQLKSRFCGMSTSLFHVFWGALGNFPPCSWPFDLRMVLGGHKTLKGHGVKTNLLCKSYIEENPTTPPSVDNFISFIITRPEKTQQNTFVVVWIKTSLPYSLQIDYWPHLLCLCHPQKAFWGARGQWFWSWSSPKPFSSTASERPNASVFQGPTFVSIPFTQGSNTACGQETTEFYDLWDYH